MTLEELAKKYNSYANHAQFVSWRYVYRQIRDICCDAKSTEEAKQLLKERAKRYDYDHAGGVFQHAVSELET